MIVWGWRRWVEDRRARWLLIGVAAVALDVTLGWASTRYGIGWGRAYWKWVSGT